MRNKFFTICTVLSFMACALQAQPEDSDVARSHKGLFYDKSKIEEMKNKLARPEKTTKEEKKVISEKHQKIHESFSKQKVRNSAK